MALRRPKQDLRFLGHTQLVGETDSGHGYAELLTRTGAQEALTGVRNARDTVFVGFTTVRDVGTFRALVDIALRDAIDARWITGPRMQVSGAYVTCSGGGGRQHRARRRRRAVRASAGSGRLGR